MTGIFNKRIFVNIVLIVLAVSVLVYAYPTGIVGVTRKNGDGCTCHGDASSNVTVTINGPASLKPNETGTFSVTIQGGPLAAAGTDIAASAGVLAISDNSLQNLGGELTHVSPKQPSAGVVTFNFKYTAPSTTGTVTLYANGNSVNLNGNNQGDQWNFAPNKAITITNATDVTDPAVVNKFDLQQNYPNPFNPSTIITYQLDLPGFVSVKIFDIIGNQVAVLVNRVESSGLHAVTFNGAKLNSGVYFYRLETNGRSIVRKMILTK